MQTDNFNYNLPRELIALHPPKERGNARLLVMDRTSGKLYERVYADFTNYLSAGDVVILNDTKVIPARIITHKKNNLAKRELVLLESHGRQDNWHIHKALYRGHINRGDVLLTEDQTELFVTEVLDDGVILISSRITLLEVANKNGQTPLPPYLNRDAEPDDKYRYQTIWAKEEGSVAAPTASLNLTNEVIDKLTAQGVVVTYATLHVGLGTFLPIRTNDLAQHVMHKEYFVVPAVTIGAIRRAKENGKKVIAIGTTITRTLEYAAEEIMSGSGEEISGDADIFIYPGYKFKLVDGLLTNFHAPKSSVLMLAAAFAGWDNLKSAYNYAIEKRYNFLSYGDSMFIKDIAGLEERSE